MTVKTVYYNWGVLSNSNICTINCRKLLHYFRNPFCAVHCGLVWWLHASNCGIILQISPQFNTVYFFPQQIFRKTPSEVMVDGGHYWWKISKLRTSWARFIVGGLFHLVITKSYFFQPVHQQHFYVKILWTFTLCPTQLELEKSSSLG
jgi:hypothetical protein